MKIIDLLNKIANDIDVPPKQIKYKGKIYNYTDSDYFASDYGYLFDRYNVSGILNDTVEILEEEKKIPEKIEVYEDEEGHYFIDKHCKKIYITCDEVNFMVEEFNQLIDYLKSKGE